MQQQERQRSAEATEATKEAAAPAISYTAIYRAVFDFHSRHKQPPQTVEDWQALAVDAAETAKTCQNLTFAHDLIFAVYSEIERSANNAF